MHVLNAHRPPFITASQSGVLLRLSWRQVLLLVSAALVIGLYWLQASPYVNVADDSGRYLVLAKSLARTGDLRLLNDPQPPLDTLYPPGYPALIAFWIRCVGQDVSRVVMLVKATQVMLLLALLPMLYALLQRARLARGYIAAALLGAALCPALIYYANTVMSEILFAFLCLAAVLLVERDARRAPKDDIPPPWKRALALGCAGAAFLVRTAGVPLLLVLIPWFWRRFGGRWGITAAVVTVLFVGGWHLRNRRIIAHAPRGVHYATYLHQFMLRDPSRPDAGRIPKNLAGLWERVQTGVPVYTGMIPRAVLLVMRPPETFWGVVFYLIAVPLTLLILLGWWIGLRREMILSGAFSALFWTLAALWPWHNARFLFPLLPFMALYLFLGIEGVSRRLQKVAGVRPTRLLQGIGALLVLSYFLNIQKDVRHEARDLGRTPEDRGFYAACAWLKRNAPPGSLIMSRAAYTLFLYTGHPTAPISPDKDPRSQELHSMLPQHVQYLVQNAWLWANDNRYLRPYLKQYAGQWTLVWHDPAGSGVRIWQRKAAPDDPFQRSLPGHQECIARQLSADRDKESAHGLVGNTLHWPNSNYCKLAFR